MTGRGERQVAPLLVKERLWPVVGKQWIVWCWQPRSTFFVVTTPIVEECTLTGSLCRSLSSKGSCTEALKQWQNHCRGNLSLSLISFSLPTCPSDGCGAARLFQSVSFSFESHSTDLASTGAHLSPLLAALLCSSVSRFSRKFV